ncbi:MAG TPA: alcohol dehydrogenase catalytic domain-containing protein [Acidimicrobiales bacterium]|nr:alcohol dehydrogenase catalytic domain-containing protein [Acidimicrobiales bacterium]
MQAWLLESSPGEYSLRDVDLPGPGPGRVRVDLAASALNHIDLWSRKALPKPKQLPLVPGSDGAGVITAVGEGVTQWQRGDEVVVNPSFACGHCRECLCDRSVFCAEWGIMGEHYWGAHGASVLVREANLERKPAYLPWEIAAAYGLCGLTAYRMLRRARLRAGEVLLVVGVGGGVATAALALGKRFGATVFATSRSPAKRERAVQMGAEDAFPSEGKLPVKADVVVDSSGAPTWELSLGALRRGGRLAICGGTGGAKVELNLPKLFFGHLELTGSTMGTFKEFRELTELVADGLPVTLDSTFAFADYAQALERLESGEQFGKIVLVGPRT